MSSIVSTDIRSAVFYNAREARTMGWAGKIPAEAIAEFPPLALDPVGGRYADQVAFAKAVMAFQSKFPEITHDGKLGRSTWTRMQRAYAPVAQTDPFFIHNGVRVRAPLFDADGAPKLLTWEDPGGLDLHRRGKWGWAKSRTINKVLLHWGGINARHCRDSLGNAGLSSHFGVEGDVVYQWLDIGHIGYHAGFVNTDSIGIDICQQPVPGTKSDERHYYDMYRAQGKDVQITTDPSRRMGRREFMTLDSTTAETTRLLVQSLCQAFDVPYQLPRGRSGTSAEGAIFLDTMARAAVTRYRGVLTHANTAGQKPDIAGWVARIFPDMA